MKFINLNYFFNFSFLLIFYYYYFSILFTFSFALNNFCSIPTPLNTSTPPIKTPIQIIGHTDFKYALITAHSSMRSSCDIKGSVNGQNIIEIEDGGSISNLIIDDPSKGIWCKGSCTLNNIYFKKTCYHAVDFGNSQDSREQKYQVNGGAVLNAIDKVFTQAGAGILTITGFCAENFSKVYRSCGEKCSQHPRHVKMIDSNFKGPGLSLISLNYNYKDTMYINNVKATKDISFGCQEYEGTDGSAKMTPTGQCLLNDECKLKSCNYNKGSIIII